MLLGLDSLDWDDELLALFGVDRALLPRVAGSAEVVGEAELLGVTCRSRASRATSRPRSRPRLLRRGEAKATYGTGSFVLVHAGGEREPAPAGLLETAAAPGRAYALEGAILVSGAALQWLRDGLGLLATRRRARRSRGSVDSTGGVSFVPALTGLGSPHWRPDARGLVTGITRGTTRAHLVRAALEAIALRSRTSSTRSRAASACSAPTAARARTGS